ncbi:hypothetical protein [Aquibacillus kalidii]|uniref:hypothetical protein n=1 Tax=Aquibacillus kalidii TaxID=2762597 RepID=UPI0016457858|nr:hypothetical protein [Aquibacillus kalidii]
MGYILPVENYQYMEYQKRVTKEQHDPFPIEKLYPTYFHLTYNEEKNQKQEYQGNPRQFTKQKTTQSIDDKLVEKIQADLTGKGKLFSENI